MATGPLLSVNSIETAYGLLCAIRGVSIDVPEGSIVAVLGANGAGKTTLLNTIAGLLDPSRGSIAFAGQQIAGRAPDSIARLGISLVPEGRQIFPHLTVFENLSMGAYKRGDKAGIHSDMDVVFGYFPRLLERRQQPAGLLSGGEQQMLAISRALMARPKLLMLDEPSLGLSPKLIKEIYAIIRHVNSELGTTVLLIEQNAHAALSVAHYGYVMETGRIALKDTGAALLINPEIRRVYLGIADDTDASTRNARRPAP